MRWVVAMRLADQLFQQSIKHFTLEGLVKSDIYYHELNWRIGKLSSRTVATRRMQIVIWALVRCRWTLSWELCAAPASSRWVSSSTQASSSVLRWNSSFSTVMSEERNLKWGKRKRWINTNQSHTKKRKKQAATLNNAFLRTTAWRGDRSSRVRGRGPAPNNTLIENLTANTTLNFPGTRMRFETSPLVCRRQQSQFAASLSKDFCLDGSPPFFKVNHTDSVLERSPS